MPIGYRLVALAVSINNSGLFNLLDFSGDCRGKTNNIRKGDDSTATSLRNGAFNGVSQLSRDLLSHAGSTNRVGQPKNLEDYPRVPGS